MRRRIPGVLLRLSAPLLGGALATACFVGSRPTEEILGVPDLSDDFCQPGDVGTCHDGNPCTRDTCEDLWAYCLYSNDDSLIPDDGQECTVDVCEGGAARHVPAAAGTPCGAGGALQCDGKGACVGCGGDPLRCGAPTSCLAWACEGDACAPRPAPAGQALPPSEQIPGDCGVLQCDGHGGADDARGDDPMPLDGSPCEQIDCFTGARTLRPAGAACGGTCAPAESGSGTVRVSVCDGAGQCAPGDARACGIGYQCTGGGCATECTPLTQASACIPGASCVDGRCVVPEGVPGACQAACARLAELGCPAAVPGAACEQGCLAITKEAAPGCLDLAADYVLCLGEAAKAAGTCAEHRSACPMEYKKLLACEGALPGGPDAPGCSLLPCVTGFDGCECAAVCGGALLADHCAPAADGTFTCTCAKDGATVASCEMAAGCGVEKGCCAGVL